MAKNIIEIKNLNKTFGKYTAVNNMTQGLLLYDSDARIVLCNQRYLEMYNLSPDVVRPGCHFRDLIVHRKEVGSFRGDVDEFC